MNKLRSRSPTQIRPSIGLKTFTYLHLLLTEASTNGANAIPTGLLAKGIEQDVDGQRIHTISSYLFLF